MAGKIKRRIDLLLDVIEKEDIDLLAKLIEKDADVNEAYKKLLKKFASSAQTRKKLSTKEKDQAILGFIMALKNFERAGDDIKEIAESIRFIITGKFVE
jgi:phosphate uptake regulator